MELVVTTRNLSLLLPCLLVQVVRVTTAKKVVVLLLIVFFFHYFHPIFYCLESFIHATLFWGR